MAGAGYKLFATGDVLTAAQVNTYLMQQSVMVFASAAARTTAISGVLAEGMVTYLQDTNSLEFYDGSGWVAAVGDVTGITASSPLTGGGSSGAVTIAIQDATTSVKGAVQLSDSTSTTSSVLASTPTATKSAYDLAALAYAPAFTNNFYAGKNKIINADFRYNQRAFTSTTTTGTYGYDRFKLLASDGTSTYSANTFALGAAPVSGYEGTNFPRLVSTGQTLTTARTVLFQPLESVRTLAGQTATISFWAKASTGTPSVAAAFAQIFGSGGSPSTAVDIPIGKTAITTSWARYSFTVAVPSISGKTIGTNGDDQLGVYLFTSAGNTYNTLASSLGIQSATIDFWGVQVEIGSVATPFQTASGSIGGELALCQRYYFRAGGTANSAGAYSSYASYGYVFSATAAFITISFPQTMRTTPASFEFSNIAVNDSTNASWAVTAASLDGALPTNTGLNLTISGATAGRYGRIINNNNAAGYIGISAEL